jgi:hypothetical protein
MWIRRVKYGENERESNTIVGGGLTDDRVVV